MSDPLVCAVMLTRDRPAMAKRAVECFRRQSYDNKKLLIWDTGLDRAFTYKWHLLDNEHVTEDVPDFAIGELRNRANGWPYTEDAQIIMHWDSDDWSHPNRVAEQVALLQSGDLDAVGYNEMLFWRATPHVVTERVGDIRITKHGIEADVRPHGQAWLYRNNDPRYCIGTSLCYWRKTWEAKPFNPKLPERCGGTGEDTEWIRGLRTRAMSSLVPRLGESPMMIATIHGSNTQDYSGIETAHNWTRVPEWDGVCRKTMEL